MANQRAWLAVSLVCFSLQSAQSDAAGTVDPTTGQPTVPGTGVNLPNPFTFGALPPTYNTGAAAGLAAKFSSCISSSTALGVLGALTTARGGSKGVTGGSKLEDACVSTDGKPIGDDLGELNDLSKCELLQSDGKYDPSKLKHEQDRIDQMTALLQCRENKFKQVKSQLDCLTVQSNQITQQVNALRQVYTDSIHKMQSDVADLASQSKNRASQIEDINTKLSGDPKGTGTTGLLAAQQATRALVQQMTDSIYKLKEAQKKAANERKSLVERAQQRTMGLTKDCFTTQTRAEFRCFTSGTANNPAQTAKEYLLCRYRQNQTQVSDGGVVIQNGIQAAVGNQKADELGSLLEEIFSESPDSNQTTNDPTKFQQQIDKVVTVLSVADVERVYGGRLKAFDGKGIPVHDYVMKYLGSCFQKATVSVNNERARTNSSLGIAEESVKAEERANSTAVQTMMNNIATQYGENMKSLTGDHLPLDVSQCYNAAPDIQANCLDQAMTNLQAQLSGVKPAANPSAPDYSMNIFIKGNDTKTDITVACAGIDGCVTKLQQYSKALGREQQKIDSFKTDYVGKAWRNTEQFTQQLRQQLSPQSEALRNQLKTLNAALATLGVDELIKIDDVQGEDLQQDDQDPNKGLPKMPLNILGMIGSKMSPPLLNVAGENFSGALGSIGKASNELKNKEAKLAQYKVRLGPLAENCKKKDLEAPIAELKAEADQFKSCVPYLCDGENAKGGDITSLMGAIRDAIGTGYPGMTGLSDVSGILSSGNSECSRKKDAYKQKREDKQTALRRAQDDVDPAQRKSATADSIVDTDRKRCEGIQAKISGLPDTAKQEDRERLSTQLGDCQRQLQSDITAAESASKDLRTAKRAVDDAQKALTELTSQSGGSDTSNCASITENMDSKLKRLEKRARDIASDSSSAK